MNLTDHIQRAVIRSSPYPPFRWAYAAAYGAMLLWLVMRIRRIPEIRYLELRMPRRDHRFGSSDLDLRAETNALSGSDFLVLSDQLADVLRPSKRWMRILDFYLFGPAEAQLQRHLAPISFGDSRWIRLVGRGKSIPGLAAELGTQPPSEHEAICRAMYEYGCLSEELVQGALDIHSTRNLYRRLMRIDDEFGSVPRARDSDLERLRERIRREAGRIARGGQLRALDVSGLEELFLLTLYEVESISEGSASGSMPHLRFQSIDKPIRPPSLSGAIGSCATAITELCSRLSGRVQSAMLGGVPASCFDYRIYLILRDGLEMPERREVFRALRELYTAPDSYRRLPNTYLRLRHPMVLTSSVWRATSRWYHALRPVEEFFFLIHHGVVLWGNDLRQELAPPADGDVIRSAAIAASDLRNGIWSAVHDRRPRQLADALLGRIPALWLLFARSTIATSSPEALAGCAAACFSGIALLDDLRTHLAGIPPEHLPSTDDPLWRPALEAASAWTDEIVEMAVAQLESHSKFVQLEARPSAGGGKVWPAIIDACAERL